MECVDAPLKKALKAMPAEGAVLVLEEEGLGLYALDMPGSGAVRVDLAEGAMGWRLAANRAKHEMVVKACAIKASESTRVFDATAGLLRDTAVLAAAGAFVHVVERSPIIAALVEDGLRRAALQTELVSIVSRIQFQAGEALPLLQALASSAEKPDVVYLDPMFPHRDKSALVKKEMRVFRAVVGTDDDTDALLAVAMKAAKRRVVVKRPRLAPPLAGLKPTMTLEGKSGRFDIYLTA
jgi:16S rRNA (guanine1516-N2)-methyltransferase